VRIAYYLLPIWYNCPNARMVNCAQTGSQALKPDQNNKTTNGGKFDGDEAGRITRRLVKLADLVVGADARKQAAEFVQVAWLTCERCAGESARR
jgi:hypothetical protein